MNKCEPFKDMILTDYIDGELKPDARRALENHLRDCGDCRAFLKEVKAQAVLPFQAAGHQEVPAELWERIKEGLHEDPRPALTWEGVLEQLKGLLVFPKLVPVLASLGVMMIIGSVSLNTIRIQKAQETEQGEYLASVIEPTGSIAMAETNDLGTPIERYFL